VTIVPISRPPSILAPDDPDDDREPDRDQRRREHDLIAEPVTMLTAGL
jgi:hypothetical protein